MTTMRVTSQTVVSRSRHRVMLGRGVPMEGPNVATVWQVGLVFDTQWDVDYLMSQLRLLRAEMVRDER